MTRCFRRAASAWRTTLFQDTQPRSAAKEYLQILQLAAKESETAVDDALRVLLNADEPFDCQAVKALVCREEELPAATTVHVETTDLASFDALFSDKEVFDDQDGGYDVDVDGTLTGVAVAHVP